ncbi:hypothetical protein TCON_2193, partial [Astathelohania contejeani]
MNLLFFIIYFQNNLSENVHRNIFENNNQTNITKINSICLLDVFENNAHHCEISDLKIQIPKIIKAISQLLNNNFHCSNKDIIKKLLSNKKIDMDSLMLESSKIILKECHRLSNYIYSPSRIASFRLFATLIKEIDISFKTTINNIHDKTSIK